MALFSLRPINLETTTSFSYYEEIAKVKKNKRGEILYGEVHGGSVLYSELYNHIKEKYNFYDKNNTSLELIGVPTIFMDDEKEALQHCYDKGTTALTTLKREIIQNQVKYYQSKCAYCGTGSIDGMDHYVPKGGYPDYSVHPHNLIPCCSHCNGKKLEAFLNENGSRIIFNPYFDTVDNKVLNLNIEYLPSNNSFMFSLDITDDRYSPHIERLKIKSKYESEAVNIFDSMINDILGTFGGHSGVYNSLSEYTVGHKKKYGKE